jgi:ribosomal protein L37AE/L43A
MELTREKVAAAYAGVTYGNPWDIVLRALVVRCKAALQIAAKQRGHFGCPQCDGSGGMRDGYGGAVQCQACGEYESIAALLAIMEDIPDAE